MKPLYPYIKEAFTPRGIAWNHDSIGLYIFYMVKYKTKDGREMWSYYMTKSLKYDPEISAELGFKDANAFKKYAFSCFMKQKSDIVNDFESLGYTDVTVMCSPKWIICPQVDGNDMKPWMNNVFNGANKEVNANPTIELKGGYENYAKKFDKLMEDRRKRYEEEARIKQQKRDKEYAEKTEQINKSREEFMKAHEDDPYYQYYGWPWEWSYSNGVHYAGD